MSNISKEEILEKINKIDLTNEESIFSTKLIEDILIKDGHIQISILANNDNYKILEKVGKKIESHLKKDKRLLSITPILTNEVKETKKNKKDDINIEGVKNIIAIASGKGGVGKSTLAVNLAHTFKEKGLKVGLLDADIHGPSIPHMLNLDGKPEVNEKRKIIPFEYKGIKVMSIGFLLEENQPVIWRGPMVHSAIKQMAQDTFWEEIDLLIVDMPPGTGDAQITVSQNLPLNGAIIISTPQPVALNDAKKAIGMFGKVNIEVIGIVENMSYFVLPGGEKEDIFGKDGAKNMAEELGIYFLGSIPLDKEIRINSDKGDPSKLKEEYFNKIADQLSDIFDFTKKN
ncbi:MAG: Mrp/NBP35 family ATP-binding protein [Pseudomonadota bacterium]|nr:Mrp/NBP35 family ATP-binding protein [Pseudomonadota bacterium]